MLATAGIFLFEEFRLDRRGDGLSRRNQRGVFVPVPIGLRALDVLGVLVERSGDLVSKEEIVGAVWGRTVVESANLTVQISALRRILDEGRSEQSCIQTIAARGYRFVAPVTREENAIRDQAKVFASVARLPIADKPSVAVLAFTNMSGSPEREFVADGIAEDIITALSRCPWLLVIGRNSSFAYRGGAVDLKQVGHELRAGMCSKAVSGVSAIACASRLNWSRPKPAFTFGLTATIVISLTSLQCMTRSPSR